MSSNYNIFSDDFSNELESEVIVDPTTGAIGGVTTAVGGASFDAIHAGGTGSQLTASINYTSLGFNVKGGLGIEFTASSNTVTLTNAANIITGSVRNVATYAHGTGQAIQDSNDEFRFNVNSGDSVTLCTVKSGGLRDKHMVLCGGEYGSVVAGGTVYIYGNDDDTSNLPYQGGISLAAGMGTTDNGVIQFRTGVNVSKAIINAEGHLTVSSSKAQVVITGSDEGEIFGVHRNSHPNMLVVSGSVTGSIVRVSGSLEGELFRVGGSGPGLANSAGTANMLVVSSSIASGGRVAIGYTGSSGILDISKDSANTEVVISSYHDTEATTPKITFRKSDGSAAAPALVDDNAVLGTIAFQGYDGSGWEEGARIEARIDGTPSDGSDMPTELTFWTTPNSSATAVQRMTIDTDGDVAIGATIPQGILHVEDSTAAAYIRTFKNNSSITNSEYLGGLVIGATENGTDYGDPVYIAGKATETWTVGSAEGAECSIWTTANGTNTLSQRMVIGQGGNVGIGTNAPTSKLHVYDASGDSSVLIENDADNVNLILDCGGADEYAYISYKHAGTNYFNVGTDAANSNNFYIYSSIGTERVFNITTGNNVGIGTASPDTKLEISKDSANAEVTISAYHDTEATTPKLTMRKADNTEASPALVDDDAVLGTISFQGYDGSGWEEGAKIEARIHGTPSDGSDLPTELTFWTTPDASATAAQRMTIDNAGNVGINTTSPDTLLEISEESANAEVTISAYHDTEATTPKITLRKADNTEASPALVDDDAVLGTISFKGYDGSGFEEGARIEARVHGTPSDGTDMPAELSFWTTPNSSATAVERMTIGQDGYVIIGASAGTTPAHSLEIKPAELSAFTTIATAMVGGLALHMGGGVADQEFAPALSWFSNDGSLDGDGTEDHIGAITMIAVEDFDASNDSGADMVFYTHPIATGGGLIERMRIDDTGQVGIGFVKGGNRKQTAMLHVSGSMAGGASALAAGLYSLAYGQAAKASSNYTLALGSSAVASATYATAIGREALADGSTSIAMGYSANASGLYATAIGRNAYASNNDGTAVGYDCWAQGQRSLAMGSESRAVNNYSMAIGHGITSSANYCIAVALDDMTSGHGDGEYVSAGQANTMAILGGKVGVGTSAPTAVLEVSGSSTGEVFSVTRWNNEPTKVLVVSGTVTGSQVRISGSDEGILFNVGSRAAPNMFAVSSSIANGSVVCIGSLPTNDTDGLHALEIRPPDAPYSSVAASALGGIGLHMGDTVAINKIGPGLSWFSNDSDLDSDKTEDTVAIITCMSSEAYDGDNESGAHLLFYTHRTATAAGLQLTMNVNADGMVSVGTNAPSGRFHVKCEDNFKSGLFPAMLIEQDDTTNNPYALEIDNTGTGDSIRDDSGAKLTAAGVFTDASDILRKTDIADLDYGLSEVMQLKPKKFKYKQTDTPSLGFIAQELEQIIPEVVYGEDAEIKDVVKSEAKEAIYNNDGTLLEPATEADIRYDQIVGGKSISYGVLTSVLVKAIQQLTARVEELEALVKD